MIGICGWSPPQVGDHVQPPSVRQEEVRDHDFDPVRLQSLERLERLRRRLAQQDFVPGESQHPHQHLADAFVVLDHQNARHQS